VAVSGKASGITPAQHRQDDAKDKHHTSGLGVTTDQRELAMRLEEHEAAVWAESVAAVSAVPGNPLQAVSDHLGPLPLVALCAIDRRDFNRVVALGVRSQVRSQDVDAICSFYETHKQRNFRIEITPLARVSELTELVTERGIAGDEPGNFKLWRKVERPRTIRPGIEVRRLDRADSDALAMLNIVAWGAWGTPGIGVWFGATVGRAGVRHYGIFDADRLVASGALFVDDRIGWFGFDATHPRYKRRGLRQAISAARMMDAAVLGCKIVHAESAVAPSARARRDGWQLLYRKHNYAPVRIEDEVATLGTGEG